MHAEPHDAGQVTEIGHPKWQASVAPTDGKSLLEKFGKVLCDRCLVDERDALHTYSRAQPICRTRVLVENTLLPPLAVRCPPTLIIASTTHLHHSVHMIGGAKLLCGTSKALEQALIWMHTASRNCCRCNGVEHGKPQWRFIRPLSHNCRRACRYTSIKHDQGIGPRVGNGSGCHRAANCCISWSFERCCQAKISVANALSFGIGPRRAICTQLCALEARWRARCASRDHVIVARSTAGKRRADGAKRHITSYTLFALAYLWREYAPKLVYTATCCAGTTPALSAGSCNRLGKQACVLEDIRQGDLMRCVEDVFAVSMTARDAQLPFAAREAQPRRGAEWHIRTHAQVARHAPAPSLPTHGRSTLWYYASLSFFSL
eukprot:scaffold88514_cov32-Tisochrysis_lutea.AAC.2